MRRFISGTLTLALITTIVFGEVQPARAADTVDAVAGELSKKYTSGDAGTGQAPSNKSEFETLRGTGGCAGYVLGHGNVVAKSESVVVAGSKKVRNKDYFIDYAAGSIVFADSVPETDAITVSYRHAEGDKGERTLLSIPGMSIAATKNLSMNLTYAYRTSGEATGQAVSDLVTYGANSTLKMGAGSSLKSMFYVSNPQNRAQLVGGSSRGSAAQSLQQGKLGELMVEEGEFGFGRMKLKMGYQNVGESFAGFSAIQESGAAPADVIGQLTKEKGLKRFDIGADLDLGHGMSVSGASKSIKDKADQIASQSLGFASSRFKANFSTSEVGGKFTRTKDIKEADRDQLAKETGMKRTNLGLSLASHGAVKDAPWNQLGMTTISDASGDINSTSAAFGLGKFGLSYSHRAIDSGFKRLGSLTKDELTAMALGIRQQYDPNATAAQVTDADRQQIMSEVANSRTNIRANFAAGSAKTDLQMLSISDGNGSIERRAAKVGGKNYTLSFMDQNIDSLFGKLGALSAVEKGEFGNERGMRRTNFAGSMKTGTGDLSMGFARVVDDNGASFIKQNFGFAGKKMSMAASFQNVGSKFTRGGDLADANRKEIQQQRGISRADISGAMKTGTGDLSMGFARISDDTGASIVKQSLGVTGKKFSLKMNHQDVDAKFDRINDLTDADKQQMLQERGFKRTDLTGNFTISKRMNLESFFYTASNDTAKLQRNQVRNKLSYTTASGARIVAFRDQYSADSADGKSSGYFHQWLSLDHKLSMLGGLSFSGLQDVNKAVNESGVEVTATVTQMHLESNKQKRTWAAADRKTADFGDGRFENTHAFNLASNPMKNLNLTGAFSTTDRNNGTETTRAYGAQWALTKQLSFNADVMNKEGVKSGTTDKRTYGLSGTVADRLSIFRNVKVAATRVSEDKDGALLKDSKSITIESGVPRVAMFKDLKLSLSRGTEDNANLRLKDIYSFKLESGMTDLGLFKGNKLTISRASESKDAKLVKDANALRFESSVMKGSFAADFASQTDAAKKHLSSRGISFTSDRADKNRLKFDVAYKTRDLGVGAPLSIRNYNLDYKLSSTMNFSYAYFSYREKPDGKVDPLGGQVMKLSKVLGRCTYIANFKQDTNFANRTDSVNYELGFSAKLASGALVEAGYSIINLSSAGNRAKGQTLHLKFDRQVNEDHFLSLSTDYKTINDAAPGAKNDIQARIDFRRVFH